MVNLVIIFFVLLSDPTTQQVMVFTDKFCKKLDYVQDQVDVMASMFKHQVKSRRNFHIIATSYGRRVETERKCFKLQYKLPEPMPADHLHLFEPIKQFDLPSRVKRLMKHLVLHKDLSREFTIIMDVEETCEKCDVSTQLTETQITDPQSLIPGTLNTLIDHASPIREQSVVQEVSDTTQPSHNQSYGENDMSGIQLTLEMSENIKMLLEINFIQEGKYIIKGDRVVLSEPCGYAYGDFITNRSRKYYVGNSLEWGISRIGKEHINVFTDD
jgi:rRNA maturation endonuclease Nob1